MEDSQPTSSSSLQDVQVIKELMVRSSRFTSLSGLSLVAAGLAALAGAWWAYRILGSYYGDISVWYFSNREFEVLKVKLLTAASIVFVAAVGGAFYFTWVKARKQKHSLWDHSSRQVFWNMALPLGAGALFILGMLHYNEWRFVAPGCLIFYGLALVNAGKYTISTIRYLGYCEVVLALINILYIGYGLYFWAIGFGVLHIIYGLIMWKNEK